MTCGKQPRRGMAVLVAKCGRANARFFVKIVCRRNRHHYQYRSRYQSCPVEPGLKNQLLLYGA